MTRSKTVETSGGNRLPESAAAPPRREGVIVEPARRRRIRLIRLWTLDYYIVRSFLASYLICALSFTGLYIAIEAITKIQRFIPAGQLSPMTIVSQFAVNLFQYHLAMVPTIYVNYMGPILTLAAAMFSLTMLNRGNEFTSIKASGVSIFRVLLPVFILATGFMGLTFILQEWIIPELREPIRKALAISRSGALRPKPFYDPVHNLHIEVQRYNPDLKVGEIVTIKQWNLGAGVAEDEPNRVIDAERMVWIPAPDSTPRNERGRWLLRNGSVQLWEAQWRKDLTYEKDEKEFYLQREHFNERQITSSMRPIDLETSDQDISYLSWRELKFQHQRQQYHHHLLTRLHHHFAFPLSHVILLLLGIPFVLNTRTRSFFLSLVVSFFLCAGYFLVSSMALSLASNPGQAPLSPILASWLPNILFGSLGLTIFTNMRT